jgi:pilus assembly protein CpaB
MRLVTIASLAASAVLGLGALFVARIALPTSAEANDPGQARVTAGVPLVVASRPIKYGEKLQAGMLTVIKVPADAAPEGAFTTVAQALAADQGAPPLALIAIAQREAVLPTKVSGPGSRPIVSAQIADGLRAYTLKVDEASGVGGHALPGDHVDVVLMRDLTPDGPQRNYISHVVVQNVRVLGVNLNSDPTSDKPAEPDTATLEVSVEDAQKLSVAASLGSLSLALRGQGQAEIADAAPIRAGDFLLGGAPRAAGVFRTASAPSAPRSAILIIEGQPTKRERAARGKPAAPAIPAAPASTAAKS